MSTREVSTPSLAFTYRYVLSAPGQGGGERGRDSVKLFRTDGSSAEQIRATWRRIAEASENISEVDLYKPEVGINTIAHVGANLAIEDITLVVTGDDFKLKIPAIWLFPEAAPGSHIHCRIKWEMFQFAPNSLSSRYVDCDIFDRVEVSKTNLKKEGLFDQERIFDSIEDGGANIGIFSIRATVQPTRSAFKGSVTISAVPWSGTDFTTKPGDVEAPSYPNIHLKMFDNVPYNGKNTEDMGLPFYTLLSYVRDDEFVLNNEEDINTFTRKLIKAVTHFYASAKKPVSLPMEDWRKMFPANNGEPTHDDIPSRYTFPTADERDGGRDVSRDG